MRVKIYKETTDSLNFMNIHEEDISLAFSINSKEIFKNLYFLKLLYYFKIN